MMIVHNFNIKLTSNIITFSHFSVKVKHSNSGANHREQAESHQNEQINLLGSFHIQFRNDDQWWYQGKKIQEYMAGAQGGIKSNTVDS